MCPPKFVPFLIQWTRFASKYFGYFFTHYFTCITFSDHLLHLKSWQKTKRWVSVLCVWQTVLLQNQEWMSRVFVLLHWYLLTNPVTFNIWSFKVTGYLHGCVTFRWCGSFPLKLQITKTLCQVRTYILLNRLS